MGNPVTVARSKLAQATRAGNQEAMEAARAEMEAAKLERLIDSSLEYLTPEQRQHLSQKIAGGK